MNGISIQTKLARALLTQFENPSQCPDPRSFGFDGSNQYYNLLYSTAKELQPELVVELGTCTGGSTSHLAAGITGKVLSIDIEIRSDAKERLLALDNVELIQGNTRSPELVKEVAKHGPIDLLFIDTDHIAEQVTAELALFGPLVRPGEFAEANDWGTEFHESNLDPHPTPFTQEECEMTQGMARFFAI